MQFTKNIVQFAWVAFFLITGCHSNIENKTEGLLKGYVVSIADGDTFTLLTNESRQLKIRLYGIDCPEKKQAFGKAAKQELSGLVYNKHVSIKQMDIDRYKRLVAIVYDEANNCVNETMLTKGFAWHYRKYDNSVYWQQLEDNARKQKRGLWADDNPIPPWQWRAAN